jgi:TetR/AcrR family transcriptional regulator, ethionamide resistance regulator
MARAPAAPEQRRRRRSPEEAEAEILDAAERLLKTRALHELTVRAVMAETTLSRNAFYVYFRDRYDLVGRVVRRLRKELNETLAEFLDPETDYATSGRRALESAARMYIEYGPILRSLEQAARTNKRAARAWESFTRPAYEGILARLKEEVGVRGVGDSDPEQLVHTLLTMTRASFFELADQKKPDVDRLVDALQRIWRRALFP